MPNKQNKIVQSEEEVLKFWQKNKIFEKSLEKKAPNGEYFFYDGPPFATGLPHYGHILSSTTKDLVGRYWTMKGYHVPRRWGWDCHGLPIENIVEQQFKTSGLKISGKKDIEEKIGVEKFNKACQSQVLKYAAEWKKMVNRIGRWVDFDNSWKTMDPTYIESVWWGMKEIWDKGLIYEGRKVLMYCPRCETPISKAEVAMDNSYKDTKDFSTVFQFKVKNEKDTYILAWSTTPWNKLVTTALAVNPDFTYVKVKEGDKKYILAKTRLYMLKGGKHEILEEIPGKKLEGLEYEPSYQFEHEEYKKKANYIVLADFVTDEEGTGVVTIAAYGEEDLEVIQKYNLPLVLHLDSKGHLKDFITPFKGMYYRKADPLIMEDLEKRGLVYSTVTEKHNSPHCWRCETELYYNPVSAWFINVQKIKPKLIKLNEKIDWYPEHLKHGRFLNILETAPDWNISRNRYFAAALPFWRCDNKDCNEVVCIGSVEELKEKSTNFDEVYKTDKVKDMDLHKHNVDKLKFTCPKCKSEMSRVPEVIDSWFEAGSMPYAELHYPFENKKEFKGRYPGQFIAEYIAQTRAWFYYMHVVAVALFNDVSFENCLTTGTILNDKGEKLSKSKMNYTDPWIIIERYGMDSLRYYLMTSVVMQADNLFFQDKEVHDVYNKVINMLWNVNTFYQLYAESYDDKVKPEDSPNVLDKWILAKLNLLNQEVTEQMDNYNTVKAGRPFKGFIEELSTWYLRRSRARFKGEDEADKKYALATMRSVLITLSQLMAPFTPYITEKIYQDLKADKDPESVHLTNWPKASKKTDEKLLEDMKVAMRIVEKAHALRDEAKMKLRQPLAELQIKKKTELLDVIRDEVNVMDVNIVDKLPKQSGDWKVKDDVALNIKLDPELRQQGNLREITRAVNAMRKKAKLTPKDKINLYYSVKDLDLLVLFTDHAKEIKRVTITKELSKDWPEDVDVSEEVNINDRQIKLALKKL